MLMSCCASQPERAAGHLLSSSSVVQNRHPLNSNKCTAAISAVYLFMNCTCDLVFRPFGSSLKWLGSNFLSVTACYLLHSYRRFGRGSSLRNSANHFTTNTIPDTRLHILTHCSLYQTVTVSCQYQSPRPHIPTHSIVKSPVTCP